MSTPPTTAMSRANAERRMTIRNLFESQRPELSKLLPRGMDIDRFYRIALTECTKNPKLLQCSAESWALALQKCVAQGLYPNSDLGLMYLIPRENNKKNEHGQWAKVWEVTTQRGYQGDLLLARNSGEVDDIYAEVVYQRDVFKVTKGLDRNIEHEPYLGDEDPGPLTHCYAVAKLKSGERAWVHLTKRDVERHKKSAFKADEQTSPWVQHTAEMWKKTAIHVLAKLLPKSPENVSMLVDDGRPAATALSIEAVRELSLPVTEAPRSALDAVKDQLRGPSAPELCTHPGLALDEVPVSQLVICEQCGEELHGTGPEEAVAAATDALAKEDKKAAEKEKPKGSASQRELDVIGSAEERR